MATSTLTKSGYLRVVNFALRGLHNIQTEANALATLDATSPEEKIKAASLVDLLTHIEDKFRSDIRRYQDATPIPNLSEEEMDSREQDVSQLHTQLWMQLRLAATPTEPTTSQNRDTTLSASTSTNPSASFTHFGHIGPQIQVPVYSGEPQHWANFIGRFTSLVHDNSQLSTLQKFQLLQNSLAPSPLKVVAHLQLTEQNYDVALQLLRNTYANPRLAISTHATQLLALPPLQGNSPESLRSFLIDFQANYNALRAMPEIKDVHETVMAAHVLKLFSQDLVKRFESQYKEKGPYPTVAELLEFLTKEATKAFNVSLLAPLKPVRHALPSPTSKKSAPARRTNPAVLLSNVAPPQRICDYCSQPGHRIFNCENFLKLTPNARYNWAKSKNKCFNCLGPHIIAKCKSPVACRVCRRMHHTLLHFEAQSPRPSKPITTSPSNSTSIQPIRQPNNNGVTRGLSQPTPPTSTLTAFETSSIPSITSQPGHSMALTCSEGSLVLMATCLVRLQISNSNYIVVRAVIDSAASSSFIASSCLKKLHGKYVPSPITVCGVGDTHIDSLGSCRLSLATLDGLPILTKHTFRILESIASCTPVTMVSATVKTATQHLTLADPTFDIPSPIQCILGAEVAAVVLFNHGPPIHLGSSLPIACPTPFGYVLLGQASSFETHSSESLNPTRCTLAATRHIAAPSPSLKELVEKFWELEEPPKLSSLSPEDLYCETFFKTTTTRDTTGRYQVRLPFVPDIDKQLGDSYKRAYASLRALERRFSRDSAFRTAYIEFMNDYIQQGHMKLATTADASAAYLIPHHGIFKKHGDTSKIRVVFNASATTTSGTSLNDLLCAGPKLQPLVSDLITLFRQYRFVFVADIKQMFRQIAIHPDDYKYQSILWRERETDPIRTYHLTTVTYGTRPAPYLACRVIKQLALDEAERCPAASAALLNNIFVDDLLVGGNTLEDARALRDSLIQLMTRGGFQLAKWRANCPSLLPESLADLTSAGDCNSTERLLGVPWNASTDTFDLSFHLEPPTKPLTKRLVLSCIAQLFDPCGWLAPVVMSAKIFLQRLWTLPLNWDTPLDPTSAAEWNSLVTCINTQSCVLSRPLSSGQHTFTLHGFGDASERGYAAVLYLVPLGPCFQATSPRLLGSRTRVAPLKRLTIPRLELCAAVLLANLAQHYFTLLTPTLTISEIHLWLDSQIVLHWLNIPPHKLKTFVANRVAQITSLTTTAKWHHVPSHDNPADIASRGIQHTSYISTDWWTGPTWMAHPHLWPTTSPTSLTSLDHSELKEVPPVGGLLCSVIPQSVLRHMSNWLRLLLVVRIILAWRFRKLNRAPSLLEVERAICYSIQQESFAPELTLLRKGREIPLRLRRLRPFLDSFGLIRVGGRLGNSESINPHPVLLPKTHPLVNALIDYYHKSLSHAGVVTLQSYLASKFWILSSRQTIRSRIFKCITCFRYRPSNSAPLMGDLPPFRVNVSLPFTHVGMDIAGPYRVKAANCRRAPTVRVYLCLFICMAVKAIHLELVDDLSSCAFLDALRRFIARRGCPSDLYSDCGTNFAGATAILKSQIKRFWADSHSSNHFTAFCFEKGITFHFNCPAAPHQGGLWERAIRSTKYHLSRILGTQLPTYQFLNSLLIQIEGVLNSRPLTQMSSDPSDIRALTPGHFLHGRPTLAYPPLDSPIGLPGGPAKSYKRVQTYLQSFWSKWVKDYLPGLQSRSKWTRRGSNLQLGDLVLIEEPNLPPRAWPLARVAALIRGKDNVVRQVQLRTPSGSYMRPAHKIYRLPIY